MIREGVVVPTASSGAATTVDVAAGSQFETLGGNLNLTFRAGMVPLDAGLAKGKQATYEISLGTNDVAQGGVPYQNGEDLPILWQGPMGPGKVFFKITVPDAAAPVIADITAT